MVLGKMIETSFRKSLILSDGSAAIFFERPVTIALLVIAVLSIAFQVYRAKRKAKSQG
jgi:putative tricarboxylic transport membrane protein